MAGEEIMKWIGGAVLTALSAIVAWVVKSTLASREALIEQGGTVKSLQEKVDKLEKEQVTVECVREVIEGALTRRDKDWDSRRVHFDKLHSLQLREAVRDEMAMTVPKIVNELRAQFVLEFRTAPPIKPT